MYHCYVCGAPTEEAPWGTEGRCPSYIICPCCGCEFGYEDATSRGVSVLRANWLATGGVWREPDYRHSFLTLDQQLLMIPKELPAGVAASSLEYAALNRSSGFSSIERHSIDFVINGMSLLKLLCARHGGHDDYMGCLVRGYPDAASSSLSVLMLGEQAPLYICPECGDIGCGQFSVLIDRSDDTVTWSRFIYENGYEEAQIVTGVGPFKFDAEHYERVLHDACEAIR